MRKTGLAKGCGSGGCFWVPKRHPPVYRDPSEIPRGPRGLPARLDYLRRRDPSGSVQAPGNEMSVLAFSKYCRVSNAAMQDYLAGRTAPNAENLVAIAEANGVSLDWLLTGEGGMRAVDGEVFQQVLAATLRPFMVATGGRATSAAELARRTVALAVHFYGIATARGLKSESSITPDALEAIFQDITDEIAALRADAMRGARRDR